MSSTQLSLTVLKISLINVGKIGCMLREKYKQTICFLAVTFFLTVFWTTCVRSVCVLSGGISGADLEAYTHLGWSILAGWWMLLCGLTIAWKVYCLFYLVFMLLICYLHWHYTIQMHVKFNIMDELHVFIGQLRGGFRTLLISVWGLFYRLMNAPLKCYYFFRVKMTF